MRIFLFLLLFLVTNAFATTTIVGGLPPCANNNYVLTYSTSTGLYACASAAAGSMDWSVAVDHAIVPDTDSAYDLGDATHGFEDLFVEKITLSGATASRAAYFDANKVITASATVSDTEMGYLDGVTGAIQTALDAKATASSSTVFTNKTFDADGSGNSISNIENADIKAAAAIALNKLAATTASRALVSDGSGFVAAATTTATEIGYVNGVTSAIQTQLGLKAALASPIFTGNVVLPTTTTGTLDQICFDFAAPGNATIPLVKKAPFGFTINSLLGGGTASGTISGELQIAGTPVTGCAAAQMPWTSTGADDTCSAANVVAAGDRVDLVTTSDSTATHVSGCVKITR